MYRKPLKIFFGSTAAAAVVRVLLKVLFVDTESGFYLGGRPLVWLLPLIMLPCAAGIVFFSLTEKNDSAAMLRGNRFIEVALLLLAIAVGAVSAMRLSAVLAIPKDALFINQLPRVLQLLCHALGVISAPVLLYIAFCLLSGAARSGTQGIVALIPAVWQTLSMLDRFITFREVSTASDQLIETLYLVCATLFFMANANCLAGVAKSRRPCVMWGLLSCHFGLVLAAGQGAAAAVLGRDISGPPLSQLIVIAAVSVYALSLVLSLAVQPADRH